MSIYALILTIAIFMGIGLMILFYLESVQDDGY